MIPKTRLQNYLRQTMPVRLGGLSANLARVASTARLPGISATLGLIDESRAFIEWSAPGLLPNRLNDAARLVDIQRGLTHWYWIWNTAQHDPAQRAQLAEQAQAWSNEILEMSGLLNEA